MDIFLHQIQKSYQSPVLQGLTYRFRSGETYAITGPSGCGKTTLLRIILGLETADKGTCTRGRFSAVFQENRLLESCSAVQNVALVLPRREKDWNLPFPWELYGSNYKRKNIAAGELSLILPWDSLNQPVSALSGGMKRRCAICRAMLSPSAAILMDEPFTGLDEDTKNHVMTYIKKRKGNRTLIFTTHQMDDLAKMKAISLPLDSPTLY